MQLELLSKHRKSLMAVAMILVMLYHSHFIVDSKVYDFVIYKNGHIGVDFFFFLSSFGLYFAYQKNSNYWQFVKRRLLRILPFSIPFILIVAPIREMSLYEVIVHITGLSCFIWRDLSFWFVSLILFLYLITPIYLTHFKYKPTLITFLCVGLVVLGCLLYNATWEFDYKFLRPAIFFLGFYFAYLYDKKVILKPWHQILLVAMSVIGWIIMYYRYQNWDGVCYYVIPMVLIVPGMLLVIAYLIDKIKFIQKPLAFLGDYTFQFYLIHPYILAYTYLIYGQIYISGINFDFWLNIVIILVSFAVSVLYKKIIDYLINRFILKETREKTHE